MARPNQKLSKRAAHRAAVEARKDQPFVKVRKQRRKPLPFPTDFFSMACEEEREGVLLTKVSRKPPTFRAETTDDKGNSIVVALQKSPRPTRGWTVMLPNGEGLYFATRRKACKYIADLEVVEVGPPNTPDVAVVSPEHHADLTEATHMKDGLGNPIRPGGTMANATDEQLTEIEATDD